MDILESAKAKIDRARHHIDELTVSIDDYLKQNPFKLVRRFNPSTNSLSISIKTSILVPNNIPLIIGDAAHCLRSALDYIYWDIMDPLVDQKKFIQFPIYGNTDESKRDMMAARLAQKAPKNVVKEIELSEPHPGGKYGIHELNDIDIQDKHKLLIVAGRAADIKANLINIILPEMPPIQGNGSIIYTGEGDDVFVLSGLPLHHPTVRRGACEEELDVPIVFDIVFANGPFAGTNVVLKLVELTANIEARCKAIWAEK